MFAKSTKSGINMHIGTFEVEGLVVENLPNTMFKVKIERADEKLVGKIILAHLSGKMRMNYIRVMPGDRVRLEMTAYDLGKGRIIFRNK